MYTFCVVFNGLLCVHLHVAKVGNESESRNIGVERVENLNKMF